MSELPEVTITENPTSVTITDNTPAVTITDGTPTITIVDNTNTITVIDASQSTTIQENELAVTITIADQPAVVVNTGVGGTYDSETLLAMLLGSLTYDQLNATLQGDIVHTRDLWTRVGTEIILTYPDGVNIQTSSQTYTDTEISSSVVDLHVTITGEVDAKISTVTQTATELEQTVTELTTDTNAALVAKQTQITQNANSIISAVSRLTSLDGPAGTVTQHTSLITQNADAITLEVTAREALDTTVTANYAEVVLNTTNIGLQVTQIADVVDRMDTAEIAITANSVTASVLSTSLSTLNYAVGAVETLLANQWSLNISEDVNGNTYSTGFQLMLHEVWLLGTDYVADDTVFFDDKVYICILLNTATTVNSPTGTSGATYWTEVVGGVKSEFVVEAEKFEVHIPGEVSTVPVFTVTGSEVTINGTLITETLEAITAYIEMNIQSTNYVAGTSGWRLDKTGNFNIYGGAATFGSGVLPNLPSDEDLVGYWSFDENSGDTVKELISDVDSTPTVGDGDDWVTGVSGSAYDLGTTGYIPLTTHPLLGKTACTITGWIKPGATLAGRGVIFDWASGSYNMLLGYDNGSDLCMFYVGDGTTSQAIANNTLVNGEWNFLVGVFEASTEISLWVNGVKETRSSVSITTVGSTAASSARLGNNIDGAIDEIRMYDRVLTDQEIQALYLNPGGLKAPIPGATNNASWEHTSDTTKIDGGEIHADSSITIGDTVDGDYCSITGGDISFYQYLASQHRMVKSLKRIENGVANNDTVTTLTGYWSEAPSIIISPYHLNVYLEAYSSQDQELRLNVEDLEETGTDTAVWRFTPTAELVISDDSAGSAVGETDDDTDTSPVYSGSFGSPWSSLANMSATTTSYNMTESNIKTVSTSIRARAYGYGAWTGSGGSILYHYYGTMPISVRLHYYHNGGWDYTTWETNVNSTNTWQTWTIESDTETNDITHIIAEARFLAASGIAAHTVFNLSSGHPEGSSDFTYLEVELVSYSADLSGTTVIATGSLNYIAIGP